MTRTNFSEAFQLLVHLKVARLFVESVLRYGLPAEYAGVIIKVRSILKKTLWLSLLDLAADTLNILSAARHQDVFETAQGPDDALLVPPLQVGSDPIGQEGRHGHGRGGRRVGGRYGGGVGGLRLDGGWKDPLRRSPPIERREEGGRGDEMRFQSRLLRRDW